jgi:hypothetical protein
MSTTPGDEGRRDRPDIPMGQTLGSPGSLARLPMPGNAEFAYLLVAVILLAIIAAVSDNVDIDNWWTSFTWLSIAYVLSRGIAKASRVLEA